jgi:Flp pilus assembly pilin Flp
MSNVFARARRFLEEETGMTRREAFIFHCLLAVALVSTIAFLGASFMAIWR